MGMKYLQQTFPSYILLHSWATQDVTMGATKMMCVTKKKEDYHDRTMEWVDLAWFICSLVYQPLMDYSMTKL